MFDYIIIGGGTSGCVVANRLSEDRNVKVLLLEAGSDFDIETVYPNLKLYAKNGPIDWNYTALPNENFGKCTKGDLYRPTYAKVLGGYSSTNFMIYSQGYDQEYNMWAKLTNESSWCYPNVLRLFKKIERLYHPEIQNSPDAYFHGFNGNVGLTKDRSPAIEKYFTAFSQGGKKIVKDINNNNKIGVTGAIYYISNGTRQNSAHAYLTRVRNRPNLYVVKNIQVTKILFDKNKRTIAVIAVKDNVTLVFRVNREIIVAAGAFNTPKLLQLSGIGPKKLLNSFNIPVISDLPVGLNYQNHMTTVLVGAIGKTNCRMIPENNNHHHYPSPTIISYASVNNSKVYPEYRTISFVVPNTPATILLDYASYYYRFNDDIANYWYTKTIGRECLWTFLQGNYPKSHGCVQISSCDPFDPPIIDTQYYSNEGDVENMVRYVKDFMEIYDTAYFKAVGAFFVDPTNGKCGSYDSDGDDYWRCYVRCAAAPLIHHAGTAAMNAVVDGRLRVKGVQGLRVADSSVMPKILSGTITIPIIMIGENAAEMIMEDNRKYCSLCTNI